MSARYNLVLSNELDKQINDVVAAKAETKANVIRKALGAIFGHDES